MTNKKEYRIVPNIIEDISLHTPTRCSGLCSNVATVSTQIAVCAGPRVLFLDSFYMLHQTVRGHRKGY